MKKILCMLALAATATLSYGQAWKFKAENLMRLNRPAEADSILRIAREDLANDPKAKPARLAELYKLSAEVAFTLAQPELLKGAGGMPFDTLAFLKYADDTRRFCELSNKYDHMPAKPGAEPKPVFVARNKEIMDKMLDYDYFCGFFFIESDKRRAADYFLKYSDAHKHPVYTQQQSDSIYAVKQANYAKSANNAMVIFYELKDWDKLLPAAAVAKTDSASRHVAYLMSCEAHLAKGDTASWVNTLKEAIEKDEDNSGYIEQLQIYYVGKNDIADAEAWADKLIAEHPEVYTGYFMKGCVELNMKKNFAAARELFEKTLSLNPEFVQAHVNIGTSYINEITDKVSRGVYKYVGTSKLVPAKDKAIYEGELKEVRGYYEKALPHYELARERFPEVSRVWAYPLYVIYSNLDNKTKAAEMKTYLEN